MNQLLLGAGLPYLVAAVIYFRRGWRASPRILVVAPAIMVAGALFAVVPDMPRLVGNTELYGRLHHTPIGDLFLLHRTIDRVEIDSPAYLFGFVLMGLSLIAAAWRELALREQGGR